MKKIYILNIHLIQSALILLIHRNTEHIMEIIVNVSSESSFEFYVVTDVYLMIDYRAFSHAK